MLPSPPRLVARAASSSAASSSTTIQLPSSLKVVGIILAVTSGILIGSSFVFKKKGLLRSQAGHTAGEGVAYLKSPLWWTGMISMYLLPRIQNRFSSYPTPVMTPMGALSVVISAMLSSIFLKEKLTFFGWLGCSLCIVCLSPCPQEQTPSQISQFEIMFRAPGFLAYISVLITIALSIIIYFGPKYGKNNMIWYITVCSTIGGISVSVTTGLGAAIVTSVMGDNQFHGWFIFFLIGFVLVTLVTEVYYLNVALALFNTGAHFIPVRAHIYLSLYSYGCVLFKGLAAPASQIITLVLAFLTICVGITILQMSKIDPVKLTSLDRRSTLLLQAARAHTDQPATIDLDYGEEKDHAGLEEPGMGALRGSFGTIGSLMRARSARRLSQSSHSTGSVRAPRGMGVGGGMVGNLDGLPFSSLQHTDNAYDGLTRHALYDAPMPSMRGDSTDRESELTTSSTQSPRRTAIKFGTQDVVHSYAPPGNRNSQAVHAVHALRTTSVPANLDTKAPPSFLYPPTSASASPASSIPPLPPPPGSGSGVGTSGGDRSVPQTPQNTGFNAQSIVIPGRANDEPPAPTVSTYGARIEPDPFDTPSTPSMSAFPSSNDLLGNESTSYLNLAESAEYTPSVGSTSSEHTVYATPVSATLPFPGRPAVNVNTAGTGAGAGSSAEVDRTRGGRRSSSASRSRRYPRGVDDAEEQQSLWDHRSPVEEEDQQGYPGVRLVQTNSRLAGTGGRF
ncbi:magnesium transporter NIPA-domain-containing protein [Lanmaoa asiatica]|nr:magnesium transporter NIPA-domain-containing protein [Lanmaoa asiatica]